MGWYLEVDHGELTSAATRLKRVLALTPDQSWHHYWSQLRLGDIEIQRGNLPEALKSYRDGLTIRDRLAKSDPGNAGWQRDLAVSFDNVGDVLVAQGNLPEALKSYRGSLTIRDRLAKSDPGNAGWQRDLEVSCDKVAIVFARQGAHAEALKQFRQAHGIATRLAALSPDNATWRSDLEWVEARIAEQQKF